MLKILVFQALHIEIDLLNCTSTKMKCIDINCMLTKFSEGFIYIVIKKNVFCIYLQYFYNCRLFRRYQQKVNPINSVKALPKFMKVIVHKSCDELTLVLQCETSTFELENHKNVWTLNGLIGPNQPKCSILVNKKCPIRKGLY